MTPDPLPTSQAMPPRATTSVVGLDLDIQIEQVEHRLMAREAWLRSTAESLGQRTQLALTPRPWVLPVVGVGVVLWLGWRWWRRREPVPRVSVNVPATVAERHDDGLADLPWAGLTAMGWPLMPAAWRGRVSPAAAAAVVSTALSIWRRLFRRHRRLR